MAVPEKPAPLAAVESAKTSESGAQTLTVSVGPQHSGSGHMRLIIELDGDIIVDAAPDPGYVHRGIEKICEVRNIIKSIPVIERPAIIDSSNLNHAYIKAIEELQGVEPPPRGKYLRCLLNEMNRIMSHLYWLSIYGVFLGHTTMFMWPLGDRELFIDLAERLTGARITHSYIVPGGVRRDLPQGLAEEAAKRTEYFEKRLDEYDKIFFNNPLFTSRSKGVGVLPKNQAIALGCTGPTLRGSGVDADLRKDEPYAAYSELDFEVPTRNEGDSYSRAVIRMDEMRESCKLIRQIVKEIPPGPIRRKAPIVVPRGEAYSRVESARGECSFYMIGEGGDKPYRVRYITGSYRNMAAIPVLLIGGHMADMPTAWWSVDYWPVEADR
ncbi:MAG TPA: NADH-quinone oxidoreductase subunit D [Candidatus Bathyarchaeia archaeon]